MVTPATRRRAGAPGVARDEGGRLWLTRAPGALRELLVVAKAEERGLTKLTVRRPLGEGNLRHEFGADPGDTRLPRRRAERGLVGPKGPHPRGEIGQRRPGESRPDLADEPRRASQSASSARRRSASGRRSSVTPARSRQSKIAKTGWTRSPSARRWRSWKRETPWRSKATISPSSTMSPSGRPCRARAISGNSVVMSLRVRE